MVDVLKVKRRDTRQKDSPMATRIETARETIETAREIAGTTPITGSGMACRYYTMGDSRGVKTFADRYTASESRNVQALAGEYDAAPRVLSKIFEMTDTAGCVRFCYVTEEITVAFDFALTRCCDTCPATFRNSSTWCFACNDLTSMAIEDSGLEDELAPVIERLTAAGFCISDIHECNYGFRDNGDCVILDFDHCIAPDESPRLAGR